MTRLNTRDLLEQVISMGDSNPAEVLALLDDGIQRAAASDDNAGQVTLARHAGVFCIHIGDTDRAARYWEVACDGAPDEGWGHLGLAQLYERLGRPDEAKARFVRSRELAEQNEDADLAKLASDGLDRLGR